eukprot:12932710-Prorocentrum_lima.AAC.1
MQDHCTSPCWGLLEAAPCMTSGPLANGGQNKYAATCKTTAFLPHTHPHHPTPTHTPTHPREASKASQTWIAG